MSEHLYDVDPDFVLPDLPEVDGATVVGPEAQHLTTVYYDTQDLRLAAHGVTLRRRQGGSDPGWQLALSSGVAAREIRVPLGKVDAPVPARLAKLVAGQTRGRDLVPVAELETARTAYRLRRPSAQELAQVSDDVVTGHRLEPAGATTTPHSWRQIEVELRTGSGTLARAVDRCLRAAGARPSTIGSRLLEDEVSPARRSGTPKTAGDVFAGYLRRQFEKMLAFDPLVRLADPRDRRTNAEDDPVFGMLAAVRGARSVLRTHQRILDPGRTGACEAELKWLDRELSRVRDLELLRGRLSATVAALPEATEEPSWLTGLDKREEAERRRLDKAMLTPRYFALLDVLERHVIEPPFDERASRKATKVTPRLLAQAWRKVLASYAAADALPPGEAQDRAWDRTLRAAGRAGHLAEAAAPVLGRPAKKVAKHATRVHDGLGEHRDALLLQRHLGEVRDADAVPTSDVYLAGLVAGIEHRNAGRSLHSVRRRWKKASKPKRLRALERSSS